MLATNRLRPRTAWDLFNQVQTDFQRELTDWISAASSAVKAPQGVWTQGDEALIVMELPGLETDNIEVSVQRDVVTIETSPSAVEDPDNIRFIRRERARNAIKRQVQLPFELDSERVDASYERGLLILRLFAHESAHPEKIEIKAG